MTISNKKNTEVVLYIEIKVRDYIFAFNYEI